MWSKKQIPCLYFFSLNFSFLSVSFCLFSVPLFTSLPFYSPLVVLATFHVELNELDFLLACINPIFFTTINTSPYFFICITLSM